jgi:hypothetical protein
MANWKTGQEGKQWYKQENGMLIAVTRTPLGDFRSEYLGFRGGMYQIGYYRTKDDAQKQCENKAFGKPVTVGRRK